MLTDEWYVPFGGIPIIFAGDNLQKQPINGVAWFKTLVECALDPSKVETNPQSAQNHGLRALKSARRYNLTRIMRAIADPAFVQAQLRMRDTTNDGRPVTRNFLNSIEPLTAADIRDDPAWRFAPIGVSSRLERDVLNIAQLERFAQHLDLPLVRWKLPLKHESLLASLDVDEAQFYDDEPHFWGYFVAGAPGLLTENIKSVRGLVNGTPFLYDSLDFGPAGPPPYVATQLAQRGFRTIELERPPAAIVVRVGSQRPPEPTAGATQRPASKHLWHGTPLPDLSAVLVPCADADADAPQLVPLFPSPRPDMRPVRGSYCAEKGIKGEFGVITHPVLDAFAMTDFKVQGRTMPKLVINLPNPVIPNQVIPNQAYKLHDLYVLVSRGKIADSLRWLERDPGALTNLTKLRHDIKYIAWDRGYDEHNDWSDAICVKAYRAVEAGRARRGRR